MANTEARTVERRDYSAPKLNQWGTVADITQVGQTNAGNDTLPGQAQGRDGGSINPPGRA
ncbi:lasso RiPP family leader peptide-containing protein [Halomonas sp. ANAO-440]|uniref:lasso RiPP family leader peptide-containing protein n=1 Tax=Halomonas sp. ANAO-440 TaxID=2861360 RepID=UPI001CAA7803|nr:lasso RiPP family leader peptide-containing protein [Halomonas sp. ANAO-440]